MSERNSTARDDRERTQFQAASQGDPIADTYDAWQRSSARLAELERSLATDRSVDPNVQALIQEVKVLRSCTVELFVLMSGSLQDGPARRSDPGAHAASFSKGSVKGRGSIRDDSVPLRS